MIRITVFLCNGQYTGFHSQGHAGFAQAGQDIVCAAVSSAVFLAANTLTEIDHSAQAQMCENEIQLRLTQITPGNQLVLKGFLLHIKELHKQYPRFIQLRYSAGRKDDIINVAH